MYLFRLDDAADYMDIDKWREIEKLFFNYDIKPIVGIIPNLEDQEIISKHRKNTSLWEDVKRWEESGWDIALHGYNHVFITKSGGLNPVNNKSEFADVEFDKQKEKIRKGFEIFKSNNIDPKIFFAPAHTYDRNTLIALREETNIRIISDTFATNAYKRFDFHFIPQQIGRPRKLPFKVVTICLHPNNMNEIDFNNLEIFIKQNKNKITCINNLEIKDRGMSLIDKFYNKIYLLYRKLRNRNK